MISNIVTALSMPTESLSWPDFQNLDQRMSKNINNLIDFKTNNNRWISTGMLIYTLIELMPKSDKRMDYEKLDRIYNEGLALANRVGITTIFNETPPIINGLFTGKCKEQWLAIMEDKTFHSSIEDLRPIRCLWHPLTSLNYWVEEGVDILSDKVAFFIVDIMALSRLLNRHLRNLREGANFSIRHFISRVIIPSVIKDIVTITMFNRLNNIFMHEKNTDDPTRIIPVWLDIIDDVNTKHTNYIDILSRSPGGFDFISANLPLTADTRLLDFITSLPSTPSVKNIFPLIFSSLTPYLNFLLAFNKSIDGVRNRTLTNSLKIQLNVMKNDKTLLSDDKDLRNQQEFNIEFMKSLI